ncbi:hypothetical protein lerEdw1_009028, partial [Lerista edwardsae]
RRVLQHSSLTLMSVQMLLLLVLSSLLATAFSGEELVEQSLPYAVVRKEDLPFSVTCTLKNTEYPWLSWYVQDRQGQLHFLATLRLTGDKENSTWQGSSYSVERVSEKLKLEVKSVAESQTLYCTCSKATVANRARDAPQILPHFFLVPLCSSQNGRRCRMMSQVQNALPKILN